MDGASELESAGYGRKAKLQQSIERAAERDAEWLAGSVAFHFGEMLEAPRGLSSDRSTWPEFLWDRFCETSEANELAESVLLSQRETYTFRALNTLYDCGYDCR